MVPPTEQIWSGTSAGPFTAEELRTLSYLADRVQQKRASHWGWLVTRVLLLLMILYVIPMMVELALLKSIGPWPSVVLGDAAGCLFLFLVGHRQSALLLYATLSSTEAYLLQAHLLAPVRLVLLTNLLPTICAVAYVTVPRLTRLRLLPQPNSPLGTEL